MLQANYLHFVKEFTNTLKFFDYALLTPEVISHEFPIIKVAIRSKDKDSFLQQLQNSFSCQIVQSKMDTTILTIDLEKNQFLTIECYHFFHSERLIYLDIEEVLTQKNISSQEISLPSWEHLLEFRILNNFLNEEGLGEEIIKRFEDLHILLQEGLLDYFNTKYDTLFQSLYELTDYKETIENHFRKQLKQFPANKFSNRMWLGWVNIKRLFKKSAIFSYLH